MQKSNIYTRGSQRKVNPSWFTAKTHMKDVGSTIGSKKHDVYHVYFENGSRTKLHQHDGDQILIATKGSGSLEIFKKEGKSRENFAIKRIQRISLKNGDTVFIPAGTLHTHGSVSSRVFSHIAVNILKSASYKTTWYESNLKNKAGSII